MENTQQFIAINKPLKLDVEHYGHWKMNMQQVIQGIDMEAWIKVEKGWTHPITTDADGKKTLKPKKSWSAEEKLEAKFNAKALSAIFTSLPRNQFTRVQGCTSANEAWDILQVSFEGTSSVKRTRIDMLESEFESLTMGAGESVDDFSSKLSYIRQETIVLGKNYKDKKLVKKFLRSLPARFQSHKSAIEVALNSDDLKFDHVVGMMQANELQLKKKEQTAGKGLALMVDQTDEIKDKVSRMVNKYFKKFEKGRHGGSSGQSKSGGERSVRKSEKQCVECEGSGHYKTDCPTLKKKNSLRCFECNGYGHTKSECLSGGKKEKSYVTLSKSDSDDDQENGEILNNFVAYLGVIEEEECEDSTKPINQDQVSNSEEEQSEFTVITTLIDELAATKKEKQLLSEENKHLVNQINTLKSELKDENAKTGNLEQKLGEQLKSIRMLTKGTTDLDNILSTGRIGNNKWGLGYQGESSYGYTKFVKESAKTEKPRLSTQSRGGHRMLSVGICTGFNLY
ncbi:hypothetical protein V5N11_004034 [Cardamine amara subsp. amara]|uniref:CCHC-type domain-containing protein n=1 Tax=Cardamine amara subsp. amara TaxID=228776 RepID=A0ABD1ACC3_CARAN